ncbi:MAG: class I SAM-dependent methyltransferase [Verrucomicrobiota bacterium]
MNCPICQIEMGQIFDATILGKYPATYFRCGECGLIKPRDPVWLPESYSRAIAETDVGLVSRNLRNLDLLGSVLTQLHAPGQRLLDVGGGYGLLCRLLRDKGWDCYTSDVYCENLFAGPYEPGADFHAPTLLAFEVFEHIDDPLAFVREKILQYGAQTFVFSTLTHAGEVPPQDWWYYTFETGQHISIYTRRTLQRLAGQIGWHYLALSDEMHIFTKDPPATVNRWVLCRQHRIISYLYRRYVNWTLRSKSLMQADYETSKERVRRTQAAP